MEVGKQTSGCVFKSDSLGHALEQSFQGSVYLPLLRLGRCWLQKHTVTAALNALVFPDQEASPTAAGAGVLPHLLSSIPAT